MAGPYPRGGIKICGVTDEAAIEACIEAAVDWVGFVFHAASPRAISAGRARDLAQRLPASGIRTVGLFVGADQGRIADIVEEAPLDVLQIYDTPERVGRMRRMFGREAWLAFPVRDASELPEPATIDCELLLVEAQAPAGSTRPGGHGGRLDWKGLRGRVPVKHWMLAGGLQPENVAEAIAASGAWLVDVSSGVERSPGVKDPALIASFARAARVAFARMGAEPAMAPFRSDPI